MSKQDKFKVPGTDVALVTSTSKMPCKSWSLPAGRKYGCPFSNGSICAHCYAQKGFYAMSGPKAAQRARWLWTLESLATADGQAAWIDHMVAAIAYYARETRLFRIHDSADFFSPAYVSMWIQVAMRLPWVQFWAPTRVWQSNGRELPESNVMRQRLTEFAALDNVTLRPSALEIGDWAPDVKGYAAGTTVHVPGGCHPAAVECMAYTRNGECGECRLCWRKDVQVSYKLH